MLERLYEGSANISLFGKSYEAYVIFRPNSGDIIVRIPHTREIDGWRLFEKVRSEGFFGKKCNLENLELLTPLGKIRKDSLSLYPVLVSPGPFSVFDSFVLKIAYSSHAGIATFVFRPVESFLVFDGQFDIDSESSVYDSSYYELLFSGFRSQFLSVPGVKVDLEEGLLYLQAGKENKSSSLEKDFPDFRGDFILIRSNLDLFELRDDLYEVLSLLNGSKVSLTLGYKNEKSEFKIAFNLSTGNRAGFDSIGNPFKAKDFNEYLVETFIKDYLSYVRQAKKEDKRRIKLFVEYFIEGISMDAILESKLITLYTALEIMDDADTLTKDSLEKAYGLEENKAEFFARLRNEIVHIGLSVREAVEKIPNDVRSKSKGRRNLDISFLGERKDWACYQFLVCVLYKKLLHLIGADDLIEKLEFDSCVVAS